jgi:hypothetical protein
MRKRHDIEAKMTLVVIEMHISLLDLENMMKAAYEGRERDMRDAMRHADQLKRLFEEEHPKKQRGPF